jgi:predicted molibdopterin-dependent oxidoreductase YjgC
LIDRTSAYQGHEKAMSQVKTTCVGCSVGCSLNLFVHDNRIVRIDGDWDGAVNHGLLCEHGRYDPMQNTHDRITTPLMRRNGTLEPVSWDEALGTVADKLKPLAGREQAGLAAIASTRLPVEVLAMFTELFSVGLKSKMVTSIEEGMTTAVLNAAAEKHGAFEGKLDVLRNADTVLCIGANIARYHMVAGFLVKRALPKGMHLIDVNTEAGPLDEFADLALKIKPGSDLALINGMQAIIVKEGLGRAALAIADPDAVIAEALQATGLAADRLAFAARMLAHAVSPVILFGKGITAQRDEKLVEAIIGLATLTGAVDGERAGLLALKGEADSAAGALLGLDQPFSLDGQEAIYVLLGDDFASKRLLQKLDKAPYLVVQASYHSALTEMAQVVLPAVLWSEQAGHFISLDGRLQEARQAVHPPEGVRLNSAILTEVAMRMNMPIKQDWQAMIHGRKSSVVLS